MSLEPSVLVVISLALLAAAALAPLALLFVRKLSAPGFIGLGTLGIVLAASSALTQIKLSILRPEYYQTTLDWLKNGTSHGIMWVPNVLLVVLTIACIAAWLEHAES